MKLIKKVNSGSRTVSPSEHKGAPGKTDHTGGERLPAGGWVQSKHRRLVFTSHIRPSRLPLCSNRRVSSERRAHVGGRLKGHEGGQVLVWRAQVPAETRSFDVRRQFHLFFQRKKFRRVRQLWEVGRVETTSGVIWFQSQVRSALGILGDAPVTIMAHEGRPNEPLRR